jgi:uncharacterized protein (TIGR03083 family)
MTDLARRSIAALRAGHDGLVSQVSAMSAEDLAQVSAASQWEVAGVLSHLGSGAEIQLGTLRSQLGASREPPAPANEDVWERWNAMGAQDRADGFVEANEALVSAYEALDADQLCDARIDLGYLPAPIEIAELVGMRLSEQTLHSWDVRVAFDAKATLAAEALPILLERAHVFLAYIAKAGAVEQRPVSVAVRVTDPDRKLGLFIDDVVSLGDTPASPDATLRLPAESWLRLMAGRLSADHTPADVEAGGVPSLEDLRRVFPGY